MSYVAWFHWCTTPAAVRSCSSLYGLLATSSILATLCVHMHVLLEEQTSYHAFKILRTCNSLGSHARPLLRRNFFPCFRVLRNVPRPWQSGFPACMSNLSYNVLAAVWCVCNTWASFQTCQNSARPKEKTHCTTATPTQLQCKKMLCMFPFRFSPALSPGSPGRRNDPDREGDGSGRHRDTGERPPPSDGVRQQGLNGVGDDGRRFPSKRRGCWQSLASALSLYSCTCCLLALLASNMPQNEPTHRTGTLRFDCIFQTCHTEDGVAIFKHATNKAATRSTKTCWNVLRPRQTQSSHT